ncbi:MAG: hemolysin family protein [Planctomycetota bacterium]
MTPLPLAVAAPLWVAETLQSVWWTAGSAVFCVLLAILEYGWQNLSRARLVGSGNSPASRQRLQRLLAEADQAETALLVLRVASQMAFVAVLVLLAQDWVPHWFPNVSPATPALLACGVAFVWVTLFCKVLPAELSLQLLETLLRFTLPAIVVLGRALSPPVELFRRLLRTFGRRGPESVAEAYTDEILATVEEGEREGHLAEHQADMIERILSLREAEVRKLMTPRTEVDSLDSGATVVQARELARRTGRSRYPVIAGTIDHVIGVVHVKDLLLPGDTTSVQRVMREPWFVPESKLIAELLAEFRKHRTHLAVVLDEFGGTAGVITIEDVLEEIVGEIEDEFDGDEEIREVKQLDPRHALAPGSMRVDEVNAALSIRLPEGDDWDTLGGFIFHTLGRLPEEGEVVHHEGVALTVKRVVDRRIDRVAIETPEAVS